MRPRSVSSSRSRRVSPDGAPTSVGFEIREIQPSEFDTLGDVTVAAYEAIDGELEPDYRRELRLVRRRARSCVVLVAVAPDGKVLGGATFIPRPGTPFSEVARNGEAEIRMLAVDPAAQGRGIGRALIMACLERARAEGQAGMALLTRPWNVAAQRLYQSFGFERDPERDWEYEPGHLLWAWALAF